MRAQLVLCRYCRLYPVWPHHGVPGQYFPQIPGDEWMLGHNPNGSYLAVLNGRLHFKLLISLNGQMKGGCSRPHQALVLEQNYPRRWRGNTQHRNYEFEALIYASFFLPKWS